MKAVNPNPSFPEIEKQLIDLWKKNNVFLRSMESDAPTSLKNAGKRSKRPQYVFYDGPPFATGLPHYGHLLAGTIKDVVGRFFTMKGYHVDRRFGWDCHGVPVEFEIQKSLDLHGAKAIREYGVAKFNEECRSIVLRYTEEWRKFVERSGRWVDFDRQYRTMDTPYMESIWWVVQRLWERGLIYEGFKCVAYSPGISTPLSNFEANLNYKNVQDPAVTVRAKLSLEKLPNVKIPNGLAVNAYIWTTTPWTLPSNMAIAVGSSITYCAVLLPNIEVAIVAKERVADLFAEPEIIDEFLGSALIGTEYQPFFAYFEAERANNAFRIYPGDAFVTDKDGTGLVHMASFGEDDLTVFLANNIKVVDPVDEDGRFDSSVADFQGLNIKEADPKIIADLKKRGLLVSHKTIEHSYPFCWRTDTPLIYKSISSWFVKVEEVKDLLLHSNSQINWVPAHLKDGRFGNWLENARDWAISRNRFWGTPIPIWKCESCEHQVCIGSVAELEQRTSAKVTDLHNHFIDSLSFKCDKCSSTMKRIPQVLDCWFESGAMPYAQAHYPFENKEVFENNFPADFIAEGLDQTRGWFYTLLVLSSALFGRPAFKNVVVNGIILAEDGRKMSKSLKNYPPPDEVMDKHGADSLRLYMLSSPATRAEELRFSEEGVKQVVRQAILPLWNSYNFLVTYALVDRWSPAQQQSSDNLLDRWILSKVGTLIEGVDASLSSYHLYTASQPILDFIDQLTNWYIRLNRKRFWGGNSEAEKIEKFAAYTTLHQVLLTFVRVLAPIAPFISEEIFQNLKSNSDCEAYDSVHLAPFPNLDEIQGLRIDRDLENAFSLFEDVILLGRTIRNQEGVKLRQPLGKITVIYPGKQELEKLKSLDSYIRDELNVKEVVYSFEEEEFVNLAAKLNTIRLGKTLGPKLGKDGMQELHKLIRELTTDDLRAIESNKKKLNFRDMELGSEDILITRSPKAGLKACASAEQVTIQLDMNLTNELRLEGLAREFVNRVQKMRKDFNFSVADRILIKYMTACPKISSALKEHQSYVMSETLAIEMLEALTEKDLNLVGSSTQLPSAQEVDGKTVIISLSRLQA